MDKQFNREDRLMRKLLNEAKEEPSVDFKIQIMKKVALRNAKIRPYEPLISKSGWIRIAAVIITFITGVTYLNSGISIPGLNFGIPDLVNIPEIKLSRTMLYAIAFVALFFLQIPFLKRFLDREYRL